MGEVAGGVYALSVVDCEQTVHSARSGVLGEKLIQGVMVCLAMGLQGVEVSVTVVGFLREGHAAIQAQKLHVLMVYPSRRQPNQAVQYSLKGHCKGQDLSSRLTITFANENARACRYRCQLETRTAMPLCR